mmetsp:Transcript_12467/g.9064  ORF Transcript_12467/g.9064 Transcript_12467/m.9064 type:complete len:131 (+) Transcript_12467:651-1043(+)
MEAADFINKCLQRKPANRLGLNGPQEVKQHIWLKDVNWQVILEMKAEAPFIPVPRPPVANKVDKDATPEQAVENQMLLRRNSIQNLFNGYDFDVEQLRHQLLQDKRKMEAEEEMSRKRVLTSHCTTVNGE